MATAQEVPVGRFEAYPGYLHTLTAKETQPPSGFEHDLIGNSNLTRNGESLHQDTLPKACPGCGAVTQGPGKEIDAGYFDLARKSVREFSVQSNDLGTRPAVEAKIFDHILHNVNQPLRADLGVRAEDLASEGMSNSHIAARRMVTMLQEDSHRRRCLYPYVTGVIT
ncbi:MAG: hypothetical protein Q9167_001559 [Letrouitia subvulpina]